MAVLHQPIDSLPLFIWEINSGAQDYDEAEMMLRAITICRQRRFLLKESSKDNNVLLSLHFRGSFEVELSLYHAKAIRDVQCIRHHI